MLSFASAGPDRTCMSLQYSSWGCAYAILQNARMREELQALITRPRTWSVVVRIPGLADRTESPPKYPLSLPRTRNLAVIPAVPERKTI